MPRGNLIGLGRRPESLSRNPSQFTPTCIRVRVIEALISLGQYITLFLKISASKISSLSSLHKQETKSLSTDAATSATELLAPELPLQQLNVFASVEEDSGPQDEKTEEDITGGPSRSSDGGTVHILPSLHSRGIRRRASMTVSLRCLARKCLVLYHVCINAYRSYD